ncbi:WLM domain-containing protein [Trametes gibbosa]|nr:WLM domain-containing protein [Trametes gibbosa]
MPDVFVNALSHLKDRPNADKALLLLQRVASLVKPIMRKHGWVLPVLSEFFPESPNLLGLNINAGQKILVRLRPPHAPHTFYDEEDVIRTMLHELTHNVHGPHDDQFYKFLSGLEDEYAALRQSGYSGEGFHADGHRVGADISHNLPPHIAKQKAVEAAEKRRQISVILGGGGRIGGMARSNKSPRELAAEAAERRVRDEKACASGALAQAEAAKAAQESVQDDVIDLTGDDSDASPEPEIIIVDDSPSSSSSSSGSTPTSRPGLHPSASGEALSGYSSSASASAPGTPGSRTPASWSGLRPRNAHESSSSSSLSTLSSMSSSSTAPPSSANSTPGMSTPSTLTSLPRPSVRRVERGAGGGTPKIPKARSHSRPPAPRHAHTLARTPPPTRTNSVVDPHKHHRHLADVVAEEGEEAAAGKVTPLEKQWVCPRCTLVNDALALQCGACLLLRPGLADGAAALDAALAAAVAPIDGSSGSSSRGGGGVRNSTEGDEGSWTCHVCGEHGMPHDFWTCRFCGSVKVRS